MTAEERERHAARMRLANLPRRDREACKLPKARRDILRRQLYDQAQADYRLIATEPKAVSKAPFPADGLLFERL